MERISQAESGVNAFEEATHRDDDAPKQPRRRCQHTSAECEAIAAQIRALSKGDVGKRRAELRTWSIKKSALSRKSVLVLDHLLEIANFQKNGFAFIGNGKRLEVPRSTFFFALNQLVAEGVVIVEARRFKGSQAQSRYHFPTLASGQLPIDSEPDPIPEPESKPESKAESKTESKAESRIGPSQNPRGLDSCIESFPNQSSPIPPDTPQDLFLPGAGDRLIPFSGTDVTSIIAEGTKAPMRERNGGKDAERLPFTFGVLKQVAMIGANPKQLVQRYQEKTRGKKIKDPCGYLLTMARNEVAEKTGVSVDVLKQIASTDQQERGKAMAAAVGVKREPPAWKKNVAVNQDRSALTRTALMSGGKRR